MPTPTAQLIYDQGCPNVDAARANLRAALAAIGAPPSWSEHRIGDPATPEGVRGYGSPTILIDGRDVAGVAPSDDQCCRVYGAHGGVPPVEMILRALRSHGQPRPR